MFGVDEAGKGPVLGSMFAAAVRIEESADLPAGIDDSKRLAPARREEIATALREDDRVAVGVAEIPVARIDDPETDMNTLTVEGHAEALTEVLGDDPEALRDHTDSPEDETSEDGESPEDGRGVAGDAATVSGICDAGDTSEERFARRVAERVPVELDLTAEHGADEAHAVVGAASVVAKVARDAHVAQLAEQYREKYGKSLGDLGSGYPSDPTTREFLESFVAEQGCLPDCARRSWSTCEDVLAAAEQSGLGEF